jgi:MarR family transcriptional regulator for hemolysin
MLFDPDHTLGFLVADIARLLRERFNDTANAFGLTLAQGRALVHLARNQGTSQVALAQLLEVQPITLLRLIDRLEESGLVERRPNPHDRRAQQLYLTPAADRLLEEINLLGSSLTDTAMAGLGARDRERLITLLGRVKRNLLEPASETDSATLRGRGVRP